MMSHRQLLAVAVVMLGVAQVAADLPVHCPHHVNVGTWEFSMSKGDQPKNVKCSKKPTNAQMCFYGSCFTNKVIGEADFKVDSKMKVSLANPNIAVATDPKTGKHHKGTWTNVYDEGVEVNVLDKRFFAFSHFANGRSQCAKTWPGWHRDIKNPDAAKWGCYTGQKSGDSLLEEHKAMLTESELAEHMSLLQMSLPEVEEPATKAYDKPNPSHLMKFQPEHDLIKRINAKATTWKAKHYPQFEKLTMGEFNRRAGFRPAKLKPLPRLPNDVLIEELEKETSDLPANFDWRNHEGQNYLDGVIDQACGSCYAVSTTSMVNSRIRIKTKNRVKPTIPYGQVLSCDRYNQGCAGGYPFLVEKYTEDFGLTKSGKCAKSTEQLKELGESAKSGDHQPFVRVKHYGYIGGYYGGSKTSQMMREIYKKGPIVVGLNGGYELMMYESGLFIETGEGTANSEEEKKQKGILNDFERVDHAVLVVGWAKNTHGKGKHWIIKNSYGAGWGESGYFRVPIAGDIDGITSLTSAADPVLGNEEYFMAQ